MAEGDVIENVDVPADPEQIAASGYKLRLNKDGSYVADLGKLRDAIRANGPIPNLQKVQLTFPTLADKPVTLYINFAFQSNSQLEPSSASIYTLAYGTPTGTWHFTQNVPGIILPGAPFPGGIDGSYASLGFPNALPDIKNENLQAAIESMYSYTGGNTDPLKPGLARMIIAASEAIRMKFVQEGMLTALSGATYIPDPDAIRNWGGHTLGDQ